MKIVNYISDCSSISSGSNNNACEIIDAISCDMGLLDGCFRLCLFEYGFL